MVIFITGAPMSGKTFLRKELFPDCPYVDIIDIQREVTPNYNDKTQAITNDIELLQKAEDLFIERAKAAIEQKDKSDTLILEHLLSKTDRRRRYVQAIKKVTDEPVVSIFVKNSDEITKELIKRRLKEFGDTDEQIDNNIEKEMRNSRIWYKYAEPYPSKEDGFDNALLISFLEG